jgi:penicillin-insensitive murein endopeptidase
MARARPVLMLTLFAAPIAAAVADEAARETRSWSGPAAATAEAAAKSTATPAAPAPAPAVVPPLKATVDATLPVPPAPKPATAPTKAAAVPEAVTKEPPKPAVTDPAKPAPEKADDKTEAKPEKAAKADGKKKPTPAKELFGAAKTAAPLAARAIGWYAKGCLSGAKPLAIDGPAWQVMRLSRNRNWGHPTLVALVERLAKDVKGNKEWPGLLVGDISQPRGGPMTSGHASHQVGLDADVWLTPMPDRRLTSREREDISATSMLAADVVSVDPKVWGEGQVKLIKRAASYREVERVLVHPAIKKALCEAAGTERGWLAKVRPYWGHYYHMHIRIGCPAGSTNCRSQPPPSGDDGCGAELKDWLKKVAPSKEPPKAVEKKPEKPAPKKSEVTLADLPAECRTVLAAGESTPASPAVAKAAATPDKAKAERTRAAKTAKK